MLEGGVISGQGVGWTPVRVKDVESVGPGNKCNVNGRELLASEKGRARSLGQLLRKSPEARKKGVIACTPVLVFGAHEDRVVRGTAFAIHPVGPNPCSRCLVQVLRHQPVFARCSGQGIDEFDGDEALGHVAWVLDPSFHQCWDQTTAGWVFVSNRGYIAILQPAKDRVKVVQKSKSEDRLRQKSTQDSTVGK